MKRLLLLVPVVVVVGGFGAYWAWETHHKNRAVAQLPTVISLLEQVQPFPGSIRIRHEQGEQASAHEWASAVVWRDFVSDAPCTDVKTHFEDQANKIGFRFHSKDPAYSGEAYTFRNGEYEFRMTLEPRPQFGCDIAISTNWYGFGR